MIIVEPFDIIGGLLTSSTIAEPDTSVGEVVWAPYTSAVGDERIMLSTHLRYKAAAVTTDAPDVGAAKAIPTWSVMGYTNKYRMFDQVNNSKSTSTAPLVVEITSPKGFNSVAIFNATDVTSVRYQVHSALGALIYDKTIDAIDNGKVVDYWEYFNLPVVQRYKFFVTDIPKSAGAKLTVTVNGNSSVSVGTLVIGASITLGMTLYNSNFDYIDLSINKEDEFGNITITPRAEYLFLNYRVGIEKDRLNFSVNTMKSLSKKPCVWSGTEDVDDVTTVYGYYNAYQQGIDTPSICNGTIKIRELV